MGTKTLLLALVLLVLPGAVAAENETASDEDATEPCDAVRVSPEDPFVTVEPNCLVKVYAEESK